MDIAKGCIFHFGKAEITAVEYTLPKSNM